MNLYKITGPRGEPLVAASSDRWPLPRKRGRGWQAGEWTPERKPVLCRSGWHLSPIDGISRHVGIGMLWEAEGRGKCRGDRTKIAYESARLLRPVGEITHPLLVLAACDWAEHVQPDPVPEESAAALRAARARAACPCEEHRADAARAAAYAAADAYAEATGARCLGARDERTWQGERLLELVTNSTRSTP